jgi:hypothetical protein
MIDSNIIKKIKIYIRILNHIYTHILHIRYILMNHIYINSHFKSFDTKEASRAVFSTFMSRASNACMRWVLSSMKTSNDASNERITEILIELGIVA